MNEVFTTNGRHKYTGGLAHCCPACGGMNDRHNPSCSITKTEQMIKAKTEQIMEDPGNGEMENLQRRMDQLEQKLRGSVGIDRHPVVDIKVLQRRMCLAEHEVDELAIEFGYIQIGINGKRCEGK